MARDLTRDGQAIIAALAEEDCLDAVAAAMTALVYALLLAGISEDELHRLVTLASEASG